MTEWTETVENCLKHIRSTTSTPFAFERFDCDTKQLPDKYITFFLVDDPGAAYADNKETAHVPRVQISFYFRDKSDYLTIPKEIKSLFMSAGALRSGEGRIPFNEKTRHYGWRCDFKFYEKR